MKISSKTPPHVFLGGGFYWWGGFLFDSGVYIYILTGAGPKHDDIGEWGG